MPHNYPVLYACYINIYLGNVDLTVSITNYESVQIVRKFAKQPNDFMSQSL